MPCSRIRVGLLVSPACRYRVRYPPASMKPWENSVWARSDQTLVKGRDSVMEVIPLRVNEKADSGNQAGSGQRGFLRGGAGRFRLGAGGEHLVQGIAEQG